MLFTDAPIVTPEELASAFDTELPTDVEAQNLNLPAIILESQNEVGQEILRWAQKVWGRTRSYLLIEDFSAQSRYNESAQRPRIALSQIVVTDGEYPQMWTEVKRYAAVTALHNIFRNAARRAGADRYVEARDYWADERANKYIHRVKDSGIPVVDYPCSRPGALFIPTAGKWGSDNVSVTGSTSDPTPTTYYVSITYVADASQANNESAGSDPVAVDAGSGQSIHVDLKRLKAPDGSYPYASLAKIAVPSLKATGWNLYIGTSADSMTLQNDTPISLTTRTTTVAVDSITDTGELQGPGQSALYSMKVMDTFDRA